MYYSNVNKDIDINQPKFYDLNIYPCIKLAVHEIRCGLDIPDCLRISVGGCTLDYFCNKGAFKTRTPLNYKELEILCVINGTHDSAICGAFGISQIFKQMKDRILDNLQLRVGGK
jgi:hypothetical protein